MKKTSYTNDLERNVLIGMIVNHTVLARIASIWKDDLFLSDWSNKLAGMCISYFKEHSKAPRRNIRVLFSAWAEQQKSVEDVKIMDQFLSGLSEESTKDLNTGLVLDQAQKLFNKVKLRRFIDELESLQMTGKVDDALKAVGQFNKVEIGSDGYVDVFTDESIVQDTLNRASEKLLEYPGEVGRRLVRDAFARDSFIAFMAMEKSGKTMHLIDVAWQGLLHRRKVAMFQCGDLSQHQILQRLYSRLSRVPRKPGIVKWPISATMVEGSDLPEVVYEERVHTRGMQKSDIMKGIERFRKKVGSSSLLRVSTHPMSSLTVANMCAIMDNWERTDKWVPDLIVCDYADILAPPLGRFSESRDAINENWKSLRRLSQERHCCVVTATQSKGTSYGKSLITMEDYAEDKRKFAHVTGMIGLSVTPEEKKAGIIRWNWVVLREDEFVVTDTVSVISCFPLATAHVLSV